MSDSKIAIVTGAGSGIGRAIALRFVKQGCHVLLVGRRAEKLAETAELARGGVSLAAIDVAEIGAMNDAVRQLVQDHGRPHYLIANAGINPQRTDALHTDDEHWQETLRVNLTGVHFSCQAVLPHMIELQGGAIVTTGSISGQVGMAERAAYGPSKAAVIQYTRNLAIDYAPHNIRANCICPGFVVTDMVKPWLESRSAEQLDKVISSHPLGLGKPEDIAGVAWFLCSEDARWMTGVDLSVDGGFTCW
jgi:NAD(P)-dependent dehydrogenase (short-subunit alcohol dehydrogenase family)